MKLTFQLDRQEIKRTDQQKIVSGSKNYVYAKFVDIAGDWTSPITAIFGDYTQILDENGECVVPWEVLENPGSFEVSAFCGDLHTANTATVLVEKSGYKPGETPKDPTPDAYQQYIKQVQAIVDKAVPPDGTPGYVLGATEDGNTWVPQTGGGGTGADGGYYPPAVEQTEPGTADFSWTASKAGMPTVPGVRLTLPPGQNGDPGENGITPTIGENGNWYLGTVDTGLPSRGPAYTLTAEDKQAIVQAVLAALPNAEGVGF